MKKNKVKEESNIDWKEIWVTSASIILIMGLIILFWNTYKLCQQRQNILKVVSKAVIYDGWDVYTFDGAKVLAEINSPAEFRVLAIYSGIDSGGIKIKLPNGKIGYTHFFDEKTDIDLYESTEFISIALFFTMIVFFILIWLIKTLTLYSRFFLLLGLLLYSIAVFGLLNLGWF